MGANRCAPDRTSLAHRSHTGVRVGSHRAPSWFAGSACYSAAKLSVALSHGAFVRGFLNFDRETFWSFHFGNFKFSFVYVKKIMPTKTFFLLISYLLKKCLGGI
jgi:hypothetical protein